MSLRAVVFDLDGVIRFFDASTIARAESEHGLELGTLMAAAFDPPLLEQVITGRITRVEWIQQIGEAVGSAAAAADWLGHTGNLGTVDDAMLDIVRRLRELPLEVAVLTNGTDTIPREMEALGLTHRFDRIFNTAEIGFAKPDRRAFDHVLAELDLSAGEVFFTDDTQRNIDGALTLGLVARFFSSREQLLSDLAAVGVDL